MLERLGDRNTLPRSGQELPDLPRMLLALILSLLCAYTWQNLSFSTERTNMLNPQAAVQKSWQAFVADFDDLAARLAQDAETFEGVFYRLDLPSMARSSLYYLSVDDLIQLTRTIEVVQPWLAVLSEPSGAEGLMQSLAAENSGSDAPTDPGPGFAQRPADRTAGSSGIAGPEPV